MSTRTDKIRDAMHYKATLSKRFVEKGSYREAVPEYPEDIKICMERARYLTESYRATEGEPLIIRRAKALKHVLENMTIYIDDGQLIAGNFASSPNRLPLYPELAHTWVDEALNDGLSSMLTEEEKQEYAEIIEYWKGKSVDDRVREALPEDLKGYIDSGVNFNFLFYNWRPPEALGTDDLLRVGLNGIMGKIEKRLRELDASMSDLPTNEYVEQKQALQAMLIADQAVIVFSERYADLARRLTAEEKDEKRKKGLERLGEICERVPANPPETLHEALQSYFFVYNVAKSIEAQGQAIGIRFDVVFNPFYQKDKAERRITRQEAQELFECMMLKFCEKGHLNSPNAAAVYNGMSDVKDINIGGVTPEGDDATNEFSFIILDAANSIRVPEPTVALRYHSRINPELIDKAIDVIRSGIGYPAIFNDAAVIPYLLNRGIPLEDARNWAVAACVTPIIPGKTMRTCRPNYGVLNLSACLELALYQGVNKLTGKKVGADTPDPAAFSSIEDVIEAYLTQVRFFGDKMTRIDNIAQWFYERYLQRPFASTLLEGCIEKGKDCTNWTYHDYANTLMTGTTNVADSLAVIKKFVFDDKVISMRELVEVLQNNWEGHEELRQRAINEVPKFGNDDDYVDELAAIVHLRSNEEFGRTRHYYGAKPVLDGSIAGGYHGLSLACGATPDGRRDSEPTADAAISPMAGRDRNGPTAVIKSVGKITPTYAHLFNQKFMPQFLEGENKKLFAQYLKTWADLGNWHIQFNVADKKTLLDAQEHPDKHPNFIVRIAGYSAYFVQLSREVQNDIIKRTTQSF